MNKAVKKILLERLMAKAEKYSENLNFEKSLIYYKQILKLDTNNLFALENITQKLIILKKYNEALDYCYYGLKIYNDENFIVNISLCLIHKNEFDKAINLLEKSAKRRSSYYMIYDNLGYIYFMIGDYNKSVSNYKKSLFFDKNNLLTNRCLGIVLYIELKNKEGLKYIRKAEKLGDEKSKIFLSKLK